MQLQVIVGRAELEELVRQATPLHIDITRADGVSAPRWIELERARTVELVEGRGARVVTSGRLHLDRALPIRIKELVLMLAPRVVRADDGVPRLLFKLSVERVDLAYVPGALEQALLPKINAALAPVEARLVWNFGRSLTKTLRVPPRFEPLESFRFEPHEARVVVAPEGVSLTVDVAMDACSATGATAAAPRAS